MPWNPEEYDKFKALRWRAAHDLVGALPAMAPELVVDLGCGAGRLSRLLAARYPFARVFGVDKSATMLAKAAAATSPVTWIEADVGEWQPPAPVNLLTSNAALHWLPDHDKLMPRLVGWLAPGGVLALQLPANENAASHFLVRELAATSRWASRLAGVIPCRRVHDPMDYYRWLSPHLAAVDIWTTEYLQALPPAEEDGEPPVLTWIRGTTLVPVLERLKGADLAAFLAACAEGLRQAYPPEPNGVTLYPFKRLFIVGRRAG